MAWNFKELQAKMDPASRAENKDRVRDELQMMALDELRYAKKLTQAEMAEILDVPAKLDLPNRATRRHVSPAL